MDFAAFARSRRPCLCEGSIYEKLRRDPDVEIDPYIFHAGLIYDDHGAAVLERTHREYLEVGQRKGLPMITVTDTWRANAERVAQSRFRDRRVNQDVAAFLCRIRDSYSQSGAEIFVAGQTGPRGDAYKASEALSPEAAAEFHRPQMEALCEGGVDFLIAATLPALCEAEGIARAMAATGKPYSLSFVVRRDGTLLDRTKLADAVRILDRNQPNSPVGYFVNCVHPSVFAQALEVTAHDDPAAAQRIIGLFANTSDLDPEDLDGIEELQTEAPDRLAGLMIDIHKRHGVSILGGCCGTDARHIDRIGTGLSKRT